MAPVATHPGGTRPRALPAIVAATLALSLAVPTADAQPYARFAVADSLLPESLKRSGVGFEAAWDALMVAGLRAELQRADSAAALLGLARRVAVAEPAALGSRIGARALQLRSRWTSAQRRQRVVAAVQESLGLAAQSARDYAAASARLDEALGLYRRIGEERRAAWVLGTLGQVAFQARDLPRADSLYRLALGARRQLGDLKMVGNTLNALGSTSYARARYGEAYGYYQEARAVREQTGERAALANTLNFLGNAAAALGRTDSAHIWLGQALEQAVALGDSALVSSVLINLGTLMHKTGDLEGANRVYGRALAIAVQRRDLPRQGLVRRNLGDVRIKQGRFAEASRECERAAGIYRDAGDPLGLLQALNSLGDAWLGLEEHERAGAALGRALELCDSLGVQADRAAVLKNLALAAAAGRDLAQAERRGRSAFEAAEALGDSALVHDAAVVRGHVAFLDGRPADAALSFTRALGASRGLGRPHLEADDRSHLGAALARLGRLDEAERSFDQALELAERTGVRDLVVLALLGQGDVAERRGQVPRALGHMRRAAGVIDTLRARQSATHSVGLFAGRLFAYEALIHLLMKSAPAYPDSGYREEAFAWAERARARALLDLMEGSGTAASRARPLALGEARALLARRDEALLEYSVGDSSTTLWVLRRGRWSAHTLPARAALRVRVGQLRRALASPEGAESRRAREVARALYRALLEPAERTLAGARRLRISTDDALALVPFEALLARDVPLEGPVPRGAWMVERCALSYTPSGGALAAGRGRATGRGVLAVGDPCYECAATEPGTAPLARLPHTAREVEALRSLAGEGPFLALTRAEASRGRLLGTPLLGRARVVHLATHGVADERDPARSGLWLAPDTAGAPAGFLSVDDVLGTRLSASLVTLSACETGLGRLERGEGVLGLSRAFLAGGARGVAVSLWPVQDLSTARLMARFYRLWLPGRRSADAALVAAKREIARAAPTRSPFYWAPFILVGDPD